MHVYMVRKGRCPFWVATGMSNIGQINTMSLKQKNKANGVKGSLINSDLTVSPGHYSYEEQVTSDRYQATGPEIIRRYRVQQTKKELLRVGSLNMGGFERENRPEELALTLVKRRYDICALQEINLKGINRKIVGIEEKDEEFVNENNRYKIWYCGGENNRGGVAIAVRKSWEENIIEVNNYSSRMIKIKLVCGKKIIHFFSAYAPQSGRSNKEKLDFRECFSDRVHEIPEEDIVIVGGDFNAHLGRERIGFEDVLGKFTIGDRNADGEELLQLCQQNNLKILNTWFEKQEKHLITYVSGDSESQIDFILMRKEKESVIKVKDCKTFPSEQCATQHKLLCADFLITDFKRPKRRRGEKKIKVWKLKEKIYHDEYKRKLIEKMDNNKEGWNDYKTACIEAAKEVCGETSGLRQRRRITWWWCIEVQKAIRDKKKAFREWKNDQTDENKEIYRTKAKEASREVRKAKNQAWEEWSKDIETNEGRLKMFRIAKQMKIGKKEVQGSRFIKDDNGTVLTKDSEITHRWRNFFQEITTKENPYKIGEEDITQGPLDDINELEIKDIIKGIKNGKAAGPSGLAGELIKASEEIGVNVMTNICRELFKGEIIPYDWKNSFTIPIYKGKGENLVCQNYRGIRLLEHGLKIYEKILEKRLEEIVKIENCHFGFLKGKSTTDAIFIIRQLKEKYQEKKLKLYHIFIDLEKAFDRVPREVIRWALRRQKVPERLINLIMALFYDIKSRVKTLAGISEDFDVDVGVHQGSSISPLLFIIVMEEVTKDGRSGGFWDILYADDIVLTAESIEELQDMFNKWNQQLTSKGFKINMNKSKFMISGKEKCVIETGKFPCSVCHKGVGANSVQCKKCEKWCHHRCSKLGRVSEAGENFICPTCKKESEKQNNLKKVKYPCGVCKKGVGSPSVKCTKCEFWCHMKCSGLNSIKEYDEYFSCSICQQGANFHRKDSEEFSPNKFKHLQVEGGEIEEVNNFCYLGEVLDTSQGPESAVKYRIFTAWNKWKDLASLLVNKIIPLRSRIDLYCACIRSAMLYGSETWALTEGLERRLESNELRMLRYMTGVTWHDKISNEKVRSRCKINKLGNEIRRRRLRWFGHVKRKEGGNLIEEVMNKKLNVSSPRGRPTKKWHQNIEDDLCAWDLHEDIALNRDMWRKEIKMDREMPRRLSFVE